MKFFSEIDIQGQAKLIEDDYLQPLYLDDARHLCERANDKYIPLVEASIALDRIHLLSLISYMEISIADSIAHLGSKATRS